MDDIVNRFGLETEDAGTIKVNINICFQDIQTKRKQKKAMTILKEKEKLETRKLVMKYTLALKEQQEVKQKLAIIDNNDDSKD